MVNNNNTYFDPSTMKVGSIITADGETWFHSADGEDSRVVESGELLLPYGAFSAFLTAVCAATKSALPQNCDNDTTALPQPCDNGATALQQSADNNPTTSRQRSNLADARNSRRPPLTAKQIVNQNPKVVEVLNNAKLIRTLSNGMYRSFKDFPTNAPQYIVDYLIKCNIKRTDGKDFTQETLSPIVAAMKINSRPSKFRMVYLICLSVLIAVAVTKVWGWFSSDDVSHETIQANVSQTIKTKSNFDFNDVDLICKQNKIKLTEYRINLILAKQYTDKADLEREVKAQYSAMVNAMKK